MAVVRPIEQVAVRPPGSTSGLMVGLDLAADYDSNDPIVKAYPWAFEPADNPERKTRRAAVRKSVKVESATRAPGEKRR